jgi:hypothetical protein
MCFKGFGTTVYGAGLTTELVFAALVVPVLIFRDSAQDNDAFPRQMAEDLNMFDGEGIVNRAGLWPYLTPLLGIAVIAIKHELAVQ